MFLERLSQNICSLGEESRNSSRISFLTSELISKFELDFSLLNVILGRNHCPRYLLPGLGTNWEIKANESLHQHFPLGI